MKKLALGILLVALAALTGGFFWWQWATATKFKVQSSKFKVEEKIFLVKRGESISSIGKRLQEEGLIKSSLAFRILAAKEGLGKKIQAGDFRLHPGMTPLEITQELTHGTLDVWITIPEGWRKEQVGQYLASNFQFSIFDRNQALLISNFQYEKFLRETKDVEGYLFPDTYLIPKEATAGVMVKIFLKNFEKKFDEELRRKAEKQGLSVEQVVILASIVEREAKHEEDRPIVAGILLKRWQNDWPLQTDATIQYAVASVACRLSPVACEWWPKLLTKQDLQIDSPYNTYLYKGLPPGPICNPGLASIEAVIYPQQTDYWYYLSDSQGRMHYAKTDEEHLENISRYLR